MGVGVIFSQCGGTPVNIIGVRESTTFNQVLGALDVVSEEEKFPNICYTVRELFFVQQGPEGSKL